MSHEAPVYASDLTDEQWALIEPLIPVYTWGRPRKLSMRAVVNAILYRLVTGCQWRMLPKDYPNHNSVYHHFRRWSLDGVWEQINTVLREQVRTEAALGCAWRPACIRTCSRTTVLIASHTPSRLHRRK